MTISASGVTQYNPDEMSFTPIEQWEREYIFYLKLLKVSRIVLSYFFRVIYFFFFYHVLAILDKNLRRIPTVESLLRLEEVDLLQEIHPSQKLFARESFHNGSNSQYCLARN